MTARFSRDDYAAAARALLPTGAAWSADPSSVQGKVLAALALAFWRSDAEGVGLLADAFPASTSHLAPEWEASLGLIDGASLTTEQRRKRIVARLVGAGGQSRERFIAFAASLGFAITITTHAPLRAGHFVAGDAAKGIAWASAWTVTTTGNTGGLTATALRTELAAIKPAETTLILA